MNGRIEPADCRGSTRPLAVGVVAVCFLGMAVLGTVMVVASAPSASAASLVEGFAGQASDGGEFTVAIQETNAPVERGEDLVVRAKVTAGATGGTGAVALAVAGVERDSTDVSLSGGGSETVTLIWLTGAGDAGTHEVEVSTAGDSDAVDVQVGEHGNTASTAGYSLVGSVLILAFVAFLFRDRWAPDGWSSIVE